jgi:drug/metabolite transporter (DMT)-like permease
MIGEIAALTAAFLWALSSVVYGFLGKKIPPLQLNIFKGMIAIILILLTLMIQGLKISLIAPLPLVLLALSGLIGIGLGDTAYFLALNSLGARKTLVLETLAPPLSAFLAFLVIGETISLGNWFGILLTLLGVIWVISEQNADITPVDHQRGIIWAILAAIAQAVGAVLSRFALLDSPISPLESSLIRIIAGVAIALMLTQIPFVATQPNLIKTIQTSSSRTFGIIFLAAFGGTYLGIWLQQTSLKFAPTGIAQTLLATSPLFVIPFALIIKEKVTSRSLLGVIIALAGISLLFIEL